MEKRDEFRANATRLTREMAIGHERRTGHTLVGYYVTADGISELVRECCMREGE